MSTTWRPALRIARRELLRSRGRTLLVLLMVLLPVTAVVALDTLLRTADVSVRESLPTTLGGASARIDAESSSRVAQNADLTSNLFTSGDPVGAPPLGPATIQALLPAGSRVHEVRRARNQPPVTLQGRRVRADQVAVDLDRGAVGPYALVSGRAPRSATEVAVSPDLAARGAVIGARLGAGGDDVRTVTGIATVRSDGDRTVVLAPLSFLPAGTTAQVSYYVDGPPVDWATVQALNDRGALVLSRSVVVDPPASDRVAAEVRDGSDRTVEYQVISIVAVMAVLQVVLLAGPAFAISGRRQRRALALLAAGGGEPRHVRRVVLAQGVWVGGAAALLGGPLGVLAASAARPLLASRLDARFGPFEVSLRDVVLLCLLGAATAVLAALFPAVASSRESVLAGLRSRRTTPAGAARPATAGLLLLVVGVLLTASSVDDTVGVAAAAIPTVLGVVLLAPAALSLLGRLATRLPLPLRFAVRDTDRQRGRTAPAVAAVTAVVASAVALGIGSASDAEQGRREYTPSGPTGLAVVSADSFTAGPGPDWTALRSTARTALPQARVTAVTGLTVPLSEDGATSIAIVACRLADSGCGLAQDGYSGAFNTDVLVGPAPLDLTAGQFTGADVAAARAVLSRGGVALVGADVMAGQQIELRRQQYAQAPDGSERVTVLARQTVEAVPLPLTARTGSAAFRMLLAPTVAEALGTPTTVGLAVGPSLDRAQEQTLTEALGAVDELVYVRVERGYRGPADSTVLLVLIAVTALLVLGGTLAATSLALSEARPDLRTLGQVGARPRTRRTVAASYALVLSLVGVVLGIAAGAVPGVGAAVSLTRSGYGVGTGRFAGAAGGGSVLVVPWQLVLALLVVLPLLAAGLAAAVSGRGAGVRRELA